MLKIFFLVLNISLLNALPSDHIKRSLDLIVLNTRDIFDNCSDCIELPCNIPSDPTCSLKSFHMKGSQYVSFQLSLKTIKSAWVGIVLNSADLPGMVIYKNDV